SGSTLRNLLVRSADGRLHARICGVVASRDCAGLQYARESGVPWEIVPRIDGRGPRAEGRAQEKPAFDPAKFSGRVTAVLDRWQPQLICLAGFLSPYMPPAQYMGRVLNIHPAILPEFGGPGMFGEAVHRAVLASGALASGCSVHVVDEQYDHGQVLATNLVP